MTQEKMVSNHDSVGVTVLAYSFEDACSRYISDMRNAKDKRELEYANTAIDGIIEVLENLKRYQGGNKYLYEDEDFSTFDIETLIKKVVGERATVYDERTKLIEEVEEWGGWKCYQFAMQVEKERKERREAQEASK